MELATEGGLAGGFEQSSRMAEEFEAELGRLREQMLYTSREVGVLSGGISGGLRRAFDGLAFDGDKLSDALKGVAQSMVDTAYSIAMKPVQQGLGDGIGQAVSGLMGGLFGLAQPFASGGAFSQGKVMPFARGGIVDQPTYFPMRGATGLMGEAGPEAIMPLRRGADGRLGIVAEKGGGRAVSVTINVSSPDVASFQRSQSQIATEMSRLIARSERNS